MTNHTPTSTPAPGWYPAPHANGEQRYWDGAQWTDWTPESAAAAHGTAASPSTDAKKKGLRWWAWVLIGLGALLLLIIIIGSVNAGAGTPDADAPARPVATQDTEPEPEPEPDPEPEPEPEPEDTRVDTPDVVGMTFAEARAELEDAGMVVKTVKGTGDDWIVITQTISVPTEPGTEIFIVAEAPEPVYTLAQENAIGKAQSYLSFSGFSRIGLIEQLEFEGYSREDATFGADNSGANWKAEAAEKAESYLEMTSFSRQGLYEQLEFEGFTDEEIQYGLAQVGY
jgi:pyruvate/2-oxoglutarate dehydrogenase complex dihydrolipoamide acyltransferase (E2) component